MFEAFMLLVAAIIAFLGVSLGAAAALFSLLDTPVVTRRIQVGMSIFLLFLAFVIVSWVG